MAEEREWVFSEVLKNSKDPLHCCLLWWNYTFLLKDTSKVERIVEHVCAWRVGVVTLCVICVCFEKAVLIDEYLQHVCVVVLSVLYCTCSPISHTEQKKTLCSSYKSFTVRHMHYFLCGHVFCCVDLFQGLHSAAVQTTGKQVFPNKPDKNYKSFYHTAKCILNANVILYIPPHCLVSPTLSCTTHPHQCHSFCSVTHKSSSLCGSQTSTLKLLFLLFSPPFCCF